MLGSLFWITSPWAWPFPARWLIRFGLSIWYSAAGILCVATGLVGMFIPALLQIEETHTAEAACSCQHIHASFPDSICNREGWQKVISCHCHRQLRSMKSFQPQYGQEFCSLKRSPGCDHFNRNDRFKK